MTTILHVQKYDDKNDIYIVYHLNVPLLTLSSRDFIVSVFVLSFTET